MRTVEVDRLQVVICEDRAELGRVAALEAATYLREQLALRTEMSAMFASAPSQTETLQALVEQPGINWTKLSAYHLDEYEGATADSPYAFRRYLLDELVAKVPIRHFEGLRGEATDLAAECKRYGALLAANPPACALIGIGENGHIAFNDPPAARFDDPDPVRVVDLTESCRVQQVHDRTFPTLADVPLRALTVTVPRIFAIDRLFVMVPGERKADAVRSTLKGPIAESCPSSILRKHPNATLFLDRASAARYLES